MSLLGLTSAGVRLNRVQPLGYLEWLNRIVLQWKAEYFGLRILLTGVSNWQEPTIKRIALYFDGKRNISVSESFFSLTADESLQGLN